MDVELEIGTCLRTRFRKELRVVDRLGEGSQGIVYSVIYNGRPMALKWYRPGSFYDRQGFIDNLYSNIISGSPTDSFLWPLDLVEVAGGDAVIAAVGAVLSIVGGWFGGSSTETIRVALAPRRSLTRTVKLTVPACAAYGVQRISPPWKRWG
jgi:hypothetical protein